MSRSAPVLLSDPPLPTLVPNEDIEKHDYVVEVDDDSEKGKARHDDDDDDQSDFPEHRELAPMDAFKWNVDGDQSPFPEVAACVPNTDDPTILVNSKYTCLLFR
jgi:hypothetical protein